MGGHGAGQVAGGGAAEGVEAKLQCLCGGHGNHPVFEGVGGVYAVVLEVEVIQAEDPTQVVGLDKRGVSGVNVHGVIGVDGQQVLVAPDGEGAFFDAASAGGLGDGAVVVGDLKGAEAEVADV